MSREARFEVDVGPESARAFAELSGDWNPLHTDDAHARKSAYGRPVLHGAFSAGLVSRMAGMHLPGRDCLLLGMRLKFVAPVVLPARLVVVGRITRESPELSQAAVTVSDRESGTRYVEAEYDFSHHEVSETSAASRSAATGDEVVLVTGATGGLGRAVVARLGKQALGLARRPTAGALVVPDLETAAAELGDRRVSAIVHCAWPAPDNTGLTRLGDPAAAVEHNVASPLRQMIALARLLAERGVPGATLVLIGSTAADPGRHNYRMPLYTLGKALVDPLAKILAVELGPRDLRAVGVVFDVIEAGMNQRLGRAARLAHSDRVPSGRLPDAEEAAGQIEWVLQNRSSLVNGATICLSGGAIP